MDFLLTGLSFVGGAIVSWLFAHYYYRKAQRDAQDGIIAIRLDSCTNSEKSFLVAMYTAGKPLPRYAAQITVEYERLDGPHESWAGGMRPFCRWIEQHVGHCIFFQGDDRIDEDMNTVSLSERGVECAKFLLRTEYKWAKFTLIDDSEVSRLIQFEDEHKRQPRKGKGVT